MGLTSRYCRATTFLKDSSPKPASHWPSHEVASENLRKTLSPQEFTKTQRKTITDKYSGCFLNSCAKKIGKVAVCLNRQCPEKGLLLLFLKITSSSDYGNWSACLISNSQIHWVKYISFFQVWNPHCRRAGNRKADGVSLKPNITCQKPRNVLPFQPFC